MKKILTIILFILFFGLFAPMVLAADLNVECFGTGLCSKSGLDPLFSQSNDGTWVPGVSLTKTINLKNSSSETKQIAVKATGTSEEDILKDVMMIDLAPSGGSNIFSGNLADFYDLDSINLGNLAQGENKDFNFLVRMDPLAGNEYQGKNTEFDLTLGFWSEEVELQPMITIKKTNNAGGKKIAQGSNVFYTITISVSDADASGVTVTDLLPKGFYFNNSSWKVVSSDSSRGNSGDITGLLTAPTYHSPGTWTLGNMAMGETLTLTYLADVDGSQQPGLYKDLAFAKGHSQAGETILANAVTPGMVSDNFVGTSVNVVKSGEGGTKVAVEKILKGDVLGASTNTKLPKTGADSVWLTLSGILLILGITSLSFGIFRRKNV